MRVLTPRPAITKREGSPWMWRSLGCASDWADWPLADPSAPAAKPASAAACFRNRLRPDRLESMIPPVTSNFAFELWLGPIVFSRIVRVSTGIRYLTGLVNGQRRSEQSMACAALGLSRIIGGKRKKLMI